MEVLRSLGGLFVSINKILGNLLPYRNQKPARSANDQNSGPDSPEVKQSGGPAPEVQSSAGNVASAPQAKSSPEDGRLDPLDTGQSGKPVPKVRPSAKHVSRASQAKPQSKARGSGGHGGTHIPDDGSRNILSTIKHLWLLDTPIGTIIEDRKLAAKMNILTSAGWFSDRSLVLALLMEEKDWLPPMAINDGLLKECHADLAIVSKQAVPFFSRHTEGWKFLGFFRFSRLPDSSKTCKIVDGDPPELLKLRQSLSPN